MWNANACHVFGPTATCILDRFLSSIPLPPSQFFMAPSLTSGRGELKLRRGFSKTKYKTAGRAVAVLELRYETGATLLLRGVLNPSAV